ncbi:MAG: squalene synthase HpnC [Ignavibacteria bacterium]
MNERLIQSSFKYCESIAKNHYENFPVASFLIPKEKRKYIYSIYAFARAADDFADELTIEGGKEKRLSLLDEWHGKLIDCFNGKTYDPIFIALRQTVEDCSIPIELLENLLKAFKQDVVKNRYETFEEVLLYCKNSANPVGRLVLMIFGRKDEKMFSYSDAICTALQLTNFWQDIRVDLKKNRIYVPQEDLKKFRYSEEDLFECRLNTNFKNLMKFEIERTEKLFGEGKALIGLIVNNEKLKSFSKELKLIWLGGMEILKKIRKADYDVFYRRPDISILDKIKLFAKSKFI